MIACRSSPWWLSAIAALASCEVHGSDVGPVLSRLPGAEVGGAGTGDDSGHDAIVLADAPARLNQGFII